MKYEKAFEKLIKDEGVYTDKGFDGNRTIYGITERNYPNIFEAAYQSFKNKDTTKSLSIAKDFYKRTFWNNKYDDLEYPLAEKIFSLSVNMGKKTAINLLQITLNDYFSSNLKKDGVFGNQTLSAIKSNNQTSIRSAYIFELMNYYNNIVKHIPNKKKFLLGWFNRAIS